MRSNGLSPTKAPSINTCAADGVERSSSLQGFLPARCSRALRFVTSGGGPEEDAMCCGLSTAAVAGAANPLGLGRSGWLAAVAEAAELAPAYSAVDCARDTPQENRASRQASDMVSGSRENQLRAPKSIFISWTQGPFSSDDRASRSDAKLNLILCSSGCKSIGLRVAAELCWCHHLSSATERIW
jgi:hypothetical protein